MQKIKIDDKIHLETLDLAHAQRVFELTQQNRELFRTWLVWVDGVKSVDDTIDFITMTKERVEKNRCFNCSIFYENILVGNVALIFSKGYGGVSKGELGYWLDSDVHGKGIIHKAVKKMIELGFNEYKLDKIIIRCAVLNERSCNVAQKLGFTHEGRQRDEIKVNGVVMDVDMFSLLRREYANIC